MDVKWKILWIEDDVDGFEIAARKLEEQGFLVKLVPEVKQLKAELKKSPFDLVIIDIRGETFNGLELLLNDLISVKSLLRVLVSCTAFSRVSGDHVSISVGCLFLFLLSVSVGLDIRSLG